MVEMPASRQPLSWLEKNTLGISQSKWWNLRNVKGESYTLRLAGHWRSLQRKPDMVSVAGINVEEQVSQIPPMGNRMCHVSINYLWKGQSQNTIKYLNQLFQMIFRQEREREGDSLYKNSPFSKHNRLFWRGTLQRTLTSNQSEKLTQYCVAKQKLLGNQIN